MKEIEILENLVRSLFFYGIVRKWSITQLLDEYEHLGISKSFVDEVMSKME